VRANREEFVLVGVDWDASREEKAHCRLVCLIRERGKLAIWGRHGDTAHITAVLAAGFPCTVSCEWREPVRWARQRYGFTHSVEEQDQLIIV
jgi:hypothetical protein